MFAQGVSAKTPCWLEVIHQTHLGAADNLEIPLSEAIKPGKILLKT